MLLRLRIIITCEGGNTSPVARVLLTPEIVYMYTVHAVLFRPFFLAKQIVLLLRNMFLAPTQENDLGGGFSLSLP
jgi:hypothetical protein